MPLTQEMIDAANERKRTYASMEMLPNGGSSLPHQGQTAIAGTQQVGIPATASATNTSVAPAAPAAVAPAAAPNVLAVEPTYLLDDDQFAQVLVMKNDTLRALAKAMQVDVDGDTKAIMIKKILRFKGTCTSVKSFDADTDTFEFEDLKKQDFHQPATQQSSA